MSSPTAPTFFVPLDEATAGKESQEAIVSGESPHWSETTSTPDTPAPKAHVHTRHPRLRVKPAYLKDYIVGL